MTGLSRSMVAGLGLMLGVFGAGSTAHAVVYDINIHCGGGTCNTFTPIGTLEITQVDGTSLTYDFELTSGAIINTGVTSAFMGVSGTISGNSVTGPGNTTGDTGSFGAFSYSLTTTPQTNGFNGSPNFNEGFDCTSATGGSTNCGTSFVVTFTGSNLAPFFQFDPNGTSQFQVWGGLDITCNAGITTCSITGLNPTGAVGASTAVPGPIVGAGFPGLLMACSGLVALARRRRQKIA
jgi:hypothetical protein